MTLEYRLLKILEVLSASRDEALIGKIEKLLKKEQVLPKGLDRYKKSVMPATDAAFFQMIDEGEKDVEQGRLIDADEIEKEMENW